MSAQTRIPLAHPAPANDPPQMRTFKALVAEFGFTSTRALGAWCKRRKVPYKRDGGYNWADRNAVAAAIARGETVLADPAPLPATASVGQWFDRTLGGGGQRGT